MERKVWRRPLTKVQKFEANEYVAACYHGVCNISGYVFNDTNGNGQYDPGADRYNYYNTACNHDYWIEGQEAELPSQNAFVFQDTTWERVQVGETPIFGIPIFDWVEVGVGDPVSAWNFDRVHTTTQMDLEERPNHS